MAHGRSLAFMAAVLVWQGRVAAESETLTKPGWKESREIPGAKTYMVPMRDGVKLATDVTLPKGEPGKRWPAVLVRTPYNRRGLVGEKASQIIPPFGFVAVVQDLRGRYDSEGSDYPLFGGCGWGKIRDGYDTIEWIAKQPWCNGKVATFGPSAMGLTQNLTIPTQPPHLVCAFVMVAPSDLYTQLVRWGGAPRKAMIEGWLSTNDYDPRNRQAIREHPSRDSWWDAWDTEQQAHRVNVPVVYYGGWYDVLCQGTINSFIGAQTRGGPRARGKCRLVMGPWVHEGLPKRLTYPANAEPKWPLWSMQWCARHLKGGDTSATKASTKPVSYYVMGACGEEGAPGNVWRSADTWPVPSKLVAYYLRKGGLLSTAEPTEEHALKTYSYDPKNPVPTRGGLNLILEAGPMDQRPIEDRPDVILFTTPTLTEPVEATGRIKVRLWASSSCVDTDFTAKLSDVYPDGRSMLLLDGIRRASYRESLATPKPMTPGEIYEFEIDLWSTSIIFNKGHRIRVAISSSNAPRFEPNPNTGDVSGTSDETIVAKNTIYFDKAHPSHIILPQPVEPTASGR